MQSQLSNSQQAAADWLALIDAGHYTDSWSASGDIFRNAITSAGWTQKIGAVRATLGAVQSRKESSAVALSSVEGFPDGDYVVNEYFTAFADGGNLGERVVTLVSADGVARVVGYYVI